MVVVAQGLASQVRHQEVSGLAGSAQVGSSDSPGAACSPVLTRCTPGTPLVPAGVVAICELAVVLASAAVVALAIRRTPIKARAPGALALGVHPSVFRPPRELDRVF